MLKCKNFWLHNILQYVYIFAFCFPKLQSSGVHVTGITLARSWLMQILGSEPVVWKAFSSSLTLSLPLALQMNTFLKDKIIFEIIYNYTRSSSTSSIHSSIEKYCKVSKVNFFSKGELSSFLPKHGICFRV